MKIFLVIIQFRTDASIGLILRIEFPIVYSNIKDNGQLSSETIYFFCTFDEDRIETETPDQTF